MTKNFLVSNVIDSMDEKSKGTILKSMAIFTAIELCGSILNGKTGKRTTAENFLTFCKSKYMPEKYYGISELLYSIFRCGVAHSYISKGAALLSSGSCDEERHLRFYENGLFIYVPGLAVDVSKAIRLLYEDIKQDNYNLKKNYNIVMVQLDKDGKKEFDNFVKKYKIEKINETIKRDIVTDIL